jgi:DNA polymerase-3 subunit delta'
MKNGKFTINWPLVGNQQITDYLEKCLNQNTIGGTYIFNGPDNLGKTTLAVYFAQSLLCDNFKIAKGAIPCGHCPSCLRFSARQNPDESGASEQSEIGEAHGDFHIVKKEKDKKYISVDQIRDFIRTMSMSSFSNSHKIGIIKHADKLNSESANALLKTLEEPRKDVVVILIVQDIETLPKTIVSRSQLLNFFPVKPEIIYDYLLTKNASRDDARDFARLSLGRPALAVKFLENRDFKDGFNKRAKIFLNFAKQDINERFLAIEELVGKKFVGQEAVIEAVRTLEVWQGVLRDMLLLEYGFNNLLQHQYLEADILRLKAGFSLPKLVKVFEIMKKSRDYLKANVNPKLVLDNVAVSI